MATKQLRKEVSVIRPQLSLRDLLWMWKRQMISKYTTGSDGSIHRGQKERSLFPHKSENSFLFPVWAAELDTSFLRCRLREGERLEKRGRGGKSKSPQTEKGVCGVTMINNQQVCGLVFQLSSVAEEGFLEEFTSPENKQMHLSCICKQHS